MLRKAKSPIALIMALILCISLFSGIVLAEGFKDTSDEVWASIADTESNGVVTPKDGVIFIDQDAKYAEQTEAFEYTYANGVKYWVTPDVNFFTSITAVKTHIDEFSETFLKEDHSALYDATNYTNRDGETFKDFTIVLAPGTYTDAGSGFVTVYANMTSKAIGGTTAWAKITSGHKLTILGPKAGVVAVDEDKNVNPDRSVDPTKEAVFTGTIYLAVQYSYTFTIDGIALNGSGTIRQDASGTSLWMKDYVRNIYSKASGVAGTVSVSGSSITCGATAPTNVNVLDFASSGSMVAQRSILVEDSYFEIERAQMYFAAEDTLVNNCYFKGVTSSKTTYPSLHIQIYAGKQAATLGDFDKVATSTFENCKFEQFANFISGGANKTTVAKTPLFRTYWRSDEHNGAYNATRGENGLVLTINNCELKDVIGGDTSDTVYIRMATPADKVGKFVFTNNTVSAKNDTFKSLTGGSQMFINPYNGVDKVDFDINWTIENNRFIGNIGIPFSYSTATQATNGGAVDISKNYFGNSDGSFYTPAGGRGVTYTGQYVVEGLTYHTDSFKLAAMGGASATSVGQPKPTGTGKNLQATANVSIAANAAVGASFVDSTIAAKIYSDAACTTEIDSFDELETVYVKGIKKIGNTTVSVVYTVTVSVNDPYAVIRGAEATDEEAGITYYEPADAYTIFVDANPQVKIATGEENVYYYKYGGEDLGWGDGKYYKVTEGTNFFADGASAKNLVAGNAQNTNPYKFVFAVGAYTFQLNCWAFGKTGTPTTVRVLGPQAGKTPVNNPKKGYVGDDEWGVANNRSSNPATEAVMDLGSGCELQHYTTIIYDGIAMKKRISRTPTSTATDWMIIEFHNVFWDKSDGTQIFHVSQGNSDTFHRIFRLYDTYIDYRTANCIYRSNVMAEDLVFDGVYFAGNPLLTIDPDSTASDKDQYNTYNRNILHFTPVRANNYTAENGICEFIVKNSRFEDIAYRGFLYYYQDSAYDEATRKAGTLSLVFDNNDFVKLQCGKYTSEWGDMDTNFPTVARIRSNVGGSIALQFTNNYCDSETFDKQHAAIDLYKDESWTNTPAYYSTKVENNVFVGYKRGVKYSGNGYDATKLFDNTYNYFGSVNGSLLHPTIQHGAVMNGYYLDKGLSVHTNDLEVALKSDTDLIDGVVSAYNAYTISGKMAADGALTKDSFIVKAGATATLLDASGNEIASLAGSDTKVQTGKLKVAMTGADGNEYSVTYTVTVYPPYDNYEGDKLYYDPAVASMEEGTLALYELDGEKMLFTVGENVFGAINTTNFPVDENGVSHVYFFAKEYTGFGSITSGSFYLHGAKAGINPNVATDLKTANPERATDEGETIITTGEFSVATTGKLTFDGFTFTGTSAIGFISGSAGTTRTVDFINNRNSIEREHKVATTGFFRTTVQTTNYLNVRNNRLIGISMTSNPQATIMMRNWHGIVEGNYFSAEGSNSSRIFWLSGEKSNGANAATTYDVTIQNNYLVGRVSSNVNPAFAVGYKTHFLNNTIIPLEKNTSLFTIIAYGSLVGGKPANFSTADIQIVGNTISNLNNVEGIGFVWFSYEATTDAQKADAKNYNDNIKIHNNKVDLGTKAGYIFGINDTLSEEKVVFDASNNEISNVASLRGSSPVLFEDNQSILHYNLGTGENATTINGVAADVKPDGAAITGKYNNNVTFVADSAETYTFTSTANTVALVLDENNEVVNYTGTVDLASGVNTFKVVLAPLNGAYNAEDAVEYTIIKNLATVALENHSVEKMADDDTRYTEEKPWTTFWKAEVAVEGSVTSEILSGIDLKIVDYGMYYASDIAALNDLVANGTTSNKAQKKSYAPEADKDAVSGYVNKVYKHYSYEFYGIKNDKYRFGQFYITYQLGDGENAVTVTSLSDSVACIQTTGEGIEGTVASGVTEWTPAAAE